MHNYRIAMLGVFALSLCACFTQADYHPYHGAQGPNPTATGSFIDTKYLVPTYYGYPPHPYIVIGEMDTETMGRFRNALWGTQSPSSR